MKICPKCNLENPDDATVCNRCNTCIEDAYTVQFSFSEFIARNSHLYLVLGVCIALSTFLSKTDISQNGGEFGAQLNFVPLVLSIYILGHLIHGAMAYEAYSDDSNKKARYSPLIFSFLHLYFIGGILWIFGQENPLGVTFISTFFICIEIVSLSEKTSIFVEYVFWAGTLTIFLLAFFVPIVITQLPFVPQIITGVIFGATAALLIDQIWDKFSKIKINKFRFSMEPHYPKLEKLLKFIKILTILLIIIGLICLIAFNQ